MQNKRVCTIYNMKHGEKSQDIHGKFTKSPTIVHFYPIFIPLASPPSREGYWQKRGPRKTAKQEKEWTPAGVHSLQKRCVSLFTEW